MKECSDKDRAAQAAGTAKGLKWNDFRKTECGPTASAAPATAAPEATAPSAPKCAERPACPPATTGVGHPGDAVFPTAISPEYSNESAGKARTQTCLDQYDANNATNHNGGLNWIQKGRGYYSECVETYHQVKVREEGPRKQIVLAACLSMSTAGAYAQSPSFKAQADENKPAGRRRTQQFMKKCQSDAQKACDGQAAARGFARERQ
jgi:hypothetical protein